MALAQKTVTIYDIMSGVAKRTDYPERVLRDVLAALTGVIRDELNDRHTIIVAGLGTFRAIRVKSRNKYHPGLKKIIKMPAHDKIKFNAGDWWKK